MSASKSVNQFVPVKSISIFMLLLCVALLTNCSGGDVNGPHYSFSTNGFNISDPDFTVNKTFVSDFPVDSHIRVNVEAINGEVVVTGREDINKVMVTAHLFVGSDSLQTAERQLEHFDVLVTGDANDIYIQTVQPQIVSGCKYEVEYDINVPDNLEVVTTQTNGTVTILDIQNRVEVFNENGDVFLFGIVGGILADIENGGIESTVVLPLHKTIDLFAQNGGVVLSTPTSTSAEISATVGGVGHIIVSNLHITGSVSTGKSLTGTLGNGEGSIVLSTVNGNIEVIGFD